ncbi:MAG: hypothetical protein SCALA702_22210 [Melioribacteraceae bacterium]|nr:MAG: hypothetical protein SCALA702_22210 [Melioribacteraceae bacterium]
MRIKLSCLLIFIVVTFSVTGAEGFLRTEGKKIVDANGTEIVFKGMGLGGWLVPEGYMLHTSSGGGNSPSEIKTLILDLLGEADTEEFYDNYRANYVKREDIQRMKEFGFNSIRLPFHYDNITPRNQPGVYLEEGFAIFDSLLSWCEDNEMYLILDMHCAPGGQSDENISDYDPLFPSLWESEANRERTVDIWKEIATRYKDKEWIAGYDLINEPKWELGPNNQLLRELYIDITNAIREVDTNHILYIEGNWYATDFAGLTPPWDDNMVYSFHKYWNANDQGAIQYLLDIRNQHNIPLWLGETGENSNVWFTELIQLMATHNIGWAFWPHKKFDSIAGMFSAPISEQYQQVLNYWNGSAPRPSAAFAKVALQTMTDALLLENCVYRPDVIDAMFRQVEDNSAVPFADNMVPGKVYAVNYDMGRRGVTYQDVDYQNIGGGAYNNGYSYRNDGVDIEECSDDSTIGYNVGWMDNTEWLKYTVNVQYPGTYKVRFRAASSGGGGKLKLVYNGTALQSLINIDNTGGWQNWSDFHTDTIELNAGENSILVQVIFDNFNLHYLDFIPVNVSGIDDETTPEQFNLYQNYPNPFNGSTNIKVYAPVESDASIEIFDSLGQLVKVIANKEKIQGTHVYSWEPTGANNAGSGVYLVKATIGEQTFTKKMIYLK